MARRRSSYIAAPARPRHGRRRRPRRPVLLLAAILATVIALAGVAVLVVRAPFGPIVLPGTAAATPSPRPSIHDEAGIPGPSPTIVTIGDSIMAGLGLSSSQAWPALLSSAEGISVTNLGCSGAGFIAIGDCGSDFAGLIDQAVAAQPDIVIIQSSDNDQGNSAAAIQDATAQTVAALHAALPQAQIVGFSTLWDQPDAAPPEIAAATSALSSALADTGGVFLDIGQPLRGDPALLQSDSEHPTAAGQQVLMGVIRTALIGAKVPI